MTKTKPAANTPLSLRESELLWQLLAAEYCRRFDQAIDDANGFTLAAKAVGLADVVVLARKLDVGDPSIKLDDDR